MDRWGSHYILKILFGEETSKLQDKIVILAKWYIYQCKYADRMPCCDLFLEWMNTGHGCVIDLE